MAISSQFNNLPSPLRVNLFAAEFDASQAGTPTLEQRTLLIGQALGSNYVANVPVQITREADAIALFGARSVLRHMVAAYLKADPAGDLWCIPLADHGSGVDATGTVTFTGPATAAGRMAIYVAGRKYELVIANEATATQIATALVAAITADTDAPFTAANSSGVVTITAANAGTVGNGIDIRANYGGPAAGEVTPPGVGVSIVAMASGATDPSISSAITNMGDENYDFIGISHAVSAWTTALATELGEVTGRWSPLRQVYGGVWTGRVDSVSNLTTFGGTVNDPALSVMGITGTPTPPFIIAGAYTGAAAKSIRAHAARPLQTLELPNVLPPAAGAGQTLTERNTLLGVGISTARVVGGKVQVDVAVTTYQTNASGIDDDAYMHPETRYTLMHSWRTIRADLATKYGRHILVNDGTRLGAGVAAVTPSIIKAEILSTYRKLELAGFVENFDFFAANLIVERNATNPNRLDALIPPDVANQFRQFASLVQFRLQA